MIEAVDITGRIQKVEIRTTEDSNSSEWMAYCIVIVTDEGEWRIEGCHDLSPEATRTT